LARVSNPTSAAGALIKDRKVLIVDDEVFLRNLIKRVVNKAGILLTAEAADVPTATSGLSSFKPDIVILDINMPGDSGLHLLRSIRTGETTAKRDLPVIILTSLGGEDILNTALQLDASAFVSKGEGFKQLEQRLHRVITDPFELRPAEIYAAIPIPDTEKVAKKAGKTQINKFDGNGLRISASKIKVGNTLPANLHTHAGQLLLTKGTIISPSMLKRIGDIEETFGLLLSK
jgi:two-component system chemotaxis response regulator CheY